MPECLRKPTFFSDIFSIKLKKFQRICQNFNNYRLAQ